MKRTPTALRLVALVAVCFAASGLEINCDPASARPSLADLQAQIDALSERVAELESQAACASQPQVLECDGVCTDTDEDELNCGGCGLECAPIETCVSGVCTEVCTDFDGDSYCEEVDDCDDTRADVHPGLAETCGDTLDNDCNGQINDGCPPCDPVDPAGTCDPGLTCIPYFSGEAICFLATGSGTQASPCNSLGDCAAGFTCIQVDPGTSQCLRWCDYPGGSCPGGMLCNAFSEPFVVGGQELGVCF